MWTLLLGLVFAAEGRNLALTTEPTSAQAGVRLGAGRLAFDLRAGPVFDLSTFLNEQPDIGVGTSLSTRDANTRTRFLGFAITPQVRIRTSDAPLHMSWHLSADVSLEQRWSTTRPDEGFGAPEMRWIWLFADTGPAIETALGTHWAFGVDLALVHATALWQRQFGAFPQTGRTPIDRKMSTVGTGGAFRLLLHYYPSALKSSNDD